MVERASRPVASIRLYDRAQEQGRRPTASVVIAALQECGRSKNLLVGRRIHVDIAQIGLDTTDAYIANTLITMYAKCGSLIDARTVFDRLGHRRTAVSWNTMILGYADANLGEIALDLFDRMDCAPGIVSYLAAARACASAAAREDVQEIGGQFVTAQSLRRGREIHRRAWREGHRSSRYLANSLLTMYAKCGSLIDARAVFDEIASSGETVAWNAMIFGYGEAGHGAAALRLFSRMQQEGFIPDKVTFLAVIKACSSPLRSQWFFLQGRAIHSMIAKLGYGGDVVIANALISMYSRCGSVVDGRRVFDRIETPTLVSWNSIIAAYADAGDGAMALELLSRMEESGCDPDKVTFLAALKACSISIDELERSGSDLLEEGRVRHAALASRGFHRDPFVANALVTMYSRRGSLGDARSVFETIEKPSIVSWNAIIQGYAESGEAAVALDLFSRMPQSLDPDAVTFLAVIKACSFLAAQEQGQNLGGALVKIQSLARGREIQRRAIVKNIVEREIAVANSLVTMYAKCGSMADARSVFDRMEPRSRTVVSWTALMAGYNDTGEPDRALECFERMIQEDRCNPDAVALAAVIKACGSLGALEIGRKIHSQFPSSTIAAKNPRDDLAILENSLVDFYGKCGSMDEARAVFDSIESARRDVVTWNSLIAGYSRQGDFQRTFDLLEGMMKGEERLRPNGVTILSILSVCARVGLVDQGREVFFRAASSGYGSSVVLRLEHYTVMVDLLGRSNQLEEAVGLIQGMPWEANAKIWMTLLDACAKWRNSAIAKLAFDSVLAIDRNNAAAHVLMANIWDSFF